MYKNIPVKWPPNRIIYNGFLGDDSGPFCQKCESSLKKNWLGFRTKKCIQPDCENYYANTKVPKHIITIDALKEIKAVTTVEDILKEDLDLKTIDFLKNKNPKDCVFLCANDDGSGKIIVVPEAEILRLYNDNFKDLCWQPPTGLNKGIFSQGDNYES